MTVMTIRNVDSPWWEAHKRHTAPHELLGPHIDRIVSKQTTRVDNTKRMIAVFQYGYRTGANTGGTEPTVQDTVNAYNVAKNGIETVHAKVCKARILPMPLSAGGSYMQRRKAREQGKGLEAEFDENNFERIKERAVLDALVTAHGGGVNKVFVEWGRVRMEHVPVEELFIDDVEGARGAPRSMYQVMIVDRYVLAETYGKPDPDLYGSGAERKAKILGAPSTAKNAASGNDNHDMIEVAEAWHLPSGPDAKDGRHTLILTEAGLTLLDEEWDWDCFPFAFYIPRRRPREFWGMSLMADLIAPQREFEKVTAKIQKGVQKMTGTHVIMPRSANVKVHAIDNDDGTAIEFDGNMPPTTWNPDPFNPLVVQYQQQIADMMLQHRGISSMSTQNQLPPGLQQASGKALQIWEDVEDERRLPEHRELERFVVDTAKLVMKCWRRIVDDAKGSEDGKAYEVKRRGKGIIESFRIDELLDDDDPVIQVFPVSMLAKTPSAKFAQLTEMLNIGAISVEQFKRLFDLPDLEGENDLDTADTDVIDWALDRIVFEGEYNSPQPFDKLELVIERARKFLNMCRRKGVPEDRLDMVHQYISDAIGMSSDLVAKVKEAQGAIAGAPPPGAGPPTPGGGMEAPPPADMPPPEAMPPPMAA
jgi:hypothetical protein